MRCARGTEIEHVEDEKEVGQRNREKDEEE